MLITEKDRKLTIRVSESDYTASRHGNLNNLPYKIGTSKYFIGVHKGTSGIVSSSIDGVLSLDIYLPENVSLPVDVGFRIPRDGDEHTVPWTHARIDWDAGLRRVK